MGQAMTYFGTGCLYHGTVAAERWVSVSSLIEKPPKANVSTRAEAAAVALPLGWLVGVAWLATGWPRYGGWRVRALVVCTTALGKASVRGWREARR